MSCFKRFLQLFVSPSGGGRRHQKIRGRGDDPGDAMVMENKTISLGKLNRKADVFHHALLYSTEN